MTSTGSPGTKLMRSAVNKVTTTSTPASCSSLREIMRALFIRAPRSALVQEGVEPGDRLLLDPHRAHRVPGGEAREGAAAVGEVRSEHAVHLGRGADGPDRVRHPDVVR